MHPFQEQMNAVRVHTCLASGRDARRDQTDGARTGQRPEREVVATLCAGERDRSESSNSGTEFLLSAAWATDAAELAPHAHSVSDDARWTEEPRRVAVGGITGA